MTFTPTPEQNAILEAFGQGSDLVIQAAAGTGKTSTLRLLANHTERRGTYTTYMRAIVDEAAQTMPVTLRCKTAHSLAWQAFGNQYKNRFDTHSRPNWSAVIDFLNATPLRIKAHDGSRRVLSAYQTARIVLETVKLWCQTADLDIDIRHVPIIPGLDPFSKNGKTISGKNHQQLAEYVLPRAYTAWKDLTLTDGILPFDHSYYLKGWSLTNPQLEGDYLMFDEAQDANGVLAGIVGKQTHMQRILVGDDSQAILGFAGAHNAMRDFSRQPDVKVLTLTKSFRFGPTVATAANSLLNRLDAPLRIVGNSDKNSTIVTLDTPGNFSADAVLCRTNAGALNEVINAQQRGKRVCLMGNSQELRRFVEAARELQTNGKTNYGALIAFESWAQVEEFVEQDPTGDDLATMVETVNEYGTEVLLKVLNACVKEHASDVVVSTAHKAKGKEWDNVRISTDFTLSEEGSPENLESELMLAYVALTRAKMNLDPGLLREWVEIVNPELSQNNSDFPHVKQIDIHDEKNAAEKNFMTLNFSDEVLKNLNNIALNQEITVEDFVVKMMTAISTTFVGNTT